MIEDHSDHGVSKSGTDEFLTRFWGSNEEPRSKGVILGQWFWCGSPSKESTLRFKGQSIGVEHKQTKLLIELSKILLGRSQTILHTFDNN